MGLDSVELVMNVEERFNIALPDNQCSRVRTVADLAALVMANLPADNGRCQSAVTFHELRRWLMAHAGNERRRIRPDTRLADLLPDPRAAWARLVRHRPYAPRLVPIARNRQILAWASCVLLAAWITAFALIWVRLGSTIASGFSTVALFSGVTAIVHIRKRLACHFPDGIETVADLSHRLTPLALPANEHRSRPAVERQVLEDVRKLTAEQLNLPLERVKPESSFRDLGLD